MADVTTDNQKIILTWAKVIPIVFGLLVVSNTVTGLVFNQERNTEQIRLDRVEYLELLQYNNGRSDRKDDAILKEIKQLIYISELESEIERLNRHKDD